MTDLGLGDSLPVDCARCAKAVGATIDGIRKGYEPEDGPPYRFYLVHCPSCYQTMLFVQEEWSGIGWDDPGRVYPPRATRLSDAIPDSLRRDMQEARRCAEVKCYTAAVVMARRVAEGLCLDHGYEKGQLLKRLEAMRDDGKLEPRLYEWADALRLAGNEAAHGRNPVTRDHAGEAIAMTEALLDYMYTFQARFATFKNGLKTA